LALLFAMFFVTAEPDETLGTENTTYVYTEAELLAGVADAQDGDVIVVGADITLRSMVYVESKHITIRGDGNVTISRGAGFDPAYDSVRQSYNPGMFEVAVNVHDKSDTASLTLEKITIDDRSDPDSASHTLQVPNDGGAQKDKWSSRVYDSVISARSDNTAVTLGDGAKVINIGGASAVRMLGGVLTMEEGSYVEPTNSSHRNSPAKLYGAIWLDGTSVLNYNTTMENVKFDAVYIYSDAAPATVNFNGKMNNCDIAYTLYRNLMGNGFGLYLSDKSEMNGNLIRNCTLFGTWGSNNTFEFNGKMNDNTLQNAHIFTVAGTDNTMVLNGTMNNNKDTGSAKEASDLLYIQGSRNIVDIYGEIKKNNLSTAAGAGSSVLTAVDGGNIVTLHPGSVTAENKVYIAVYRQFETTSHFHIYGEVSNNTATGHLLDPNKQNNGGAFYLSKGYATMYYGALVTGNTAFGSGGGFFLNQGATLTMYGGEISNNTAKCKRIPDEMGGYAGGGGVALTASAGSAGSEFFMTGGTITNNHSATVGGGVFVTGRQAGHRVIFEGGAIEGNTSKAAHGKDLAVGAAINVVSLTVTDAQRTSSVSGGYYVSVGKDAVLGDTSIGAGLYTTDDYGKNGIYLTDRSDAVRIGNVSGDMQATISNRASSVPEYSSYTPQNSVWYSTNRGDGTSSFIISYPVANPNKYEWIAVIQPLGRGASDLGEDSTIVTVPERTDKGLLVTVPLSIADGYAVVVMSSTELALGLERTGGGEFCIGAPGGSVTAVLNDGDVIDDFTIAPSYGWAIGSVMLVAGDGKTYDKTADALNGALKVSHGELAGGTNTITAKFVPIDEILNLVTVGSGSFYADAAGGPAYTVTMNAGDIVGDFEIAPSYGWTLESVILVAGDGTSYDKTADAVAGTLSVSYNELEGGTNTITATFVPIDEILNLVTVGNGEFYVDAAGGPVYTVTLNAGDIVDDFAIVPSPERKIGSVILVTGDGASYDRTADAIGGTLTVSYDELTGGTNTITVTFVDADDPAGGGDDGNDTGDDGDDTDDGNDTGIDDRDDDGGATDINATGETGGGTGGGSGNSLWFILPLFFGLIFLLIFLDDEEEIYGKVRYNGKGVAGVRISYTLNGVSKMTLTDKDGDYSISVDIGDEVVITGAKKGKTSVSDALPMHLRVSEDRTKVDLTF